MAQKKIETRPYDAAKYLKTEKDMADYLEAAFEDGHPAVIAAALGNISRAKEKDSTEVIPADPDFKESLLNTSSRIKTGKIKWPKHRPNE
jgi:hypothetical protein